MLVFRGLWAQVINVTCCNDLFTWVAKPKTTMSDTYYTADHSSLYLPLRNV